MSAVTTNSQVLHRVKSSRITSLSQVYYKYVGPTSCKVLWLLATSLGILALAVKIITSVFYSVKPPFTPNWLWTLYSLLACGIAENTGVWCYGTRKPHWHHEHLENSDTVTEDVKKRRSDQSDVPVGLRQEVESLYNLTMPEDFYKFWTFCTEINPDEPCDALKSSLGLWLVGPYDILSGKHKVAKKTSEVNYNLHWRFFYDPPEFQTIIVGDSKHHIGYYRDSPEELPVFLGSNDASKGCHITPTGDNVFSAVKQFAVKKLKEMSDKKTVTMVKELVEKLSSAADNLGYTLEQKTASMKRRDKRVVTKSFHGAGLVVPVDKKNDVGYRELPETDGNLKKICKAIVEASDDEKRMKAFAPIQEMITFVQFANDECDYGMGYELGIDLFCYGSHYFHKVAGQLLPLAYRLLKRDLFAEIIQSHLAKRSKENVNQLDT